MEAPWDRTSISQTDIKEYIVSLIGDWTFSCATSRVTGQGSVSTGEYATKTSFLLCSINPYNFYDFL